MFIQGKSYDLDIFFQFKAGDEGAFHQIFDCYQSRLHRKVRNFCRNEPEAEEITQEAFVQLYLKRELIEQPEGIFPFLTVVAKRRAISLFRRYILEQSYQKELEVSWKEQQIFLEQEIAYRDLRDILQETIEQLPPQQQLVYRMNKIEQLSSAEIAKHVGLSKHTVRNHLHLACKFVRFRLDKLIISLSLLFLML